MFSCKEEKPPEVISFEELTGKTNSPSAEFSDSTAESSVFIENLTPFIKSQLVDYDTMPHRKIHPLDRFGFTYSYKLDFRGHEDIPSGEKGSLEPVASLYYYSFSDTLKTKNAFYNWLDCFGSSCESVQLNKNAEELDIVSGFGVVYDTVIVSVEYLCEQKKYNWKQFETSFFVQFGENYRHRYETKCSGSLLWK